MKKNRIICVITTLFSILAIGYFIEANASSTASSKTAASKSAVDACNGLRDNEPCHYAKDNITKSGFCKKNSDGKLECIIKR